MTAPLQTDANARSAIPDTLWNARVAREKRLAAYYATAQRRPNYPAIALKLMLQTVGLYHRGLRNAKDVRLTRVTLRYATLPDALAGFRVLHLSDFHFRKESSPDRLCEVLRSVECDVCVMTGDFAYTARRRHDYLPAILQRVRDSIRTEYGVFAVLGNHDHSADVERLRGAGIRTLMNHGQAVGSGALWIGGVDDPHDYRTHDLGRALAGAPAGAFKLLLAHSPELAEEAAAQGVDLYLCGHTHGGQLCFPWGPVFLNIRCRRRYGSGVWRCGDMRGITTAGLGSTSLPVRYCCPPEAVLIELAKE